MSDIGNPNQASEKAYSPNPMEARQLAAALQGNSHEFSNGSAATYVLDGPGLPLKTDNEHLAELQSQIAGRTLCCN